MTKGSGVDIYNLAKKIKLRLIDPPD